MTEANPCGVKNARQCIRVWQGSKASYIIRSNLLILILELMYAKILFLFG